MKKILVAIILLISLSTTAQSTSAQTYTTQSYYAPIIINLSDSVNGGITFHRKAVFESLILDDIQKSVSVKVAVKFYNMHDSLMDLVQPYDKVLRLDKFTYVLSTGQVIGSLGAVVNTYGIMDTTTHRWEKDTSGKYLLKQPGIMNGYDFYNYMASQASIKLNDVITAVIKQAAKTL